MIEIYGKSACSACDTAKKLCESSGTVFAYKSLGADYDLTEFYNIAPSTHRSFPMIAKDGIYIGGLVELKGLLNV